MGHAGCINGHRDDDQTDILFKSAFNSTYQNALPRIGFKVSL